MMTYGLNLRDIIDYKLARKMFDDLPNDYDSKSKFEIVNQVRLMIELAQNNHDINHEKYTIYMKNQKDLHLYDDSFEVGDSVAYFVGDRTVGNKKKLSRKFAGPFKIVQRLRHNTVVLEDENKKSNNIDKYVLVENEDTKDRFACHTSMLKKYYKDKFIPYLEMKQSKQAKSKSKNKNQNNSNAN